MDLCMYAKNHGVPAGEAAAGVGLSVEQVKRVYDLIDSKVSSTRYLQLGAQLIDPVAEVGDKNS
jgi:NAD+ synthase